MKRTLLSIGALALGAGCQDATAPTPAVSAAQAVEAEYTVVELPALPGGRYGAEAYAINARGQVTGWSNYANSFYNHATRWVNGEPEDLGTFGGDASWATDINNGGDVVGAAQNSSGYYHAFLFTDEGGMEDLGTLAGGLQSVAVAISDNGVVVGHSDAGSSSSHAFRWTRATGMQDLGPLPGGSSSGAADISNRGEIVGASENRAVLWTQGGEIVDLGTLPGGTQPAGGPYSTAYAVNERGEVVGEGAAASQQFHAVFWTASHEIVDLGTLPGDFSSSAEGINDAGTVAGESNGFPPARGRGFVWTQPEGMRALPGLPGTYNSQVHDINNAGTVVGVSIPLCCALHATQWVHSPSPAARRAP